LAGEKGPWAPLAEDVGKAAEPDGPLGRFTRSWIWGDAGRNDVRCRIRRACRPGPNDLLPHRAPVVKNKIPL